MRATPPRGRPSPCSRNSSSRTRRRRQRESTRPCTLAVRRRDMILRWRSSPKCRCTTRAPGGIPRSRRRSCRPRNRRSRRSSRGTIRLSRRHRRDIIRRSRRRRRRCMSCRCSHRRRCMSWGRGRCHRQCTSWIRRSRRRGRMSWDRGRKRRRNWRGAEGPMMGWAFRGFVLC